MAEKKWLVDVMSASTLDEIERVFNDLGLMKGMGHGIRNVSDAAFTKELVSVLGRQYKRKPDEIADFLMGK